MRSLIFHRSTATAVALILIAMLVQTNKSSLESHFISNLGMLELTKALSSVFAHSSVQPTYPPFGVLSKANIGPQFWFQHALALDERNVSARAGLATAAFATGDAESAASLLGMVSNHGRIEPWMYIERMVALGRAGRSAEALNLYESSPPVQSSLILSDTMAWLLLQRNEPHALEAAWVFRPSDLYINYNLWKRAQSLLLNEDSQIYWKALTDFAIEALTSQDEHLMEYETQAILLLYSNGLWNYQRTLAVVQYQVWQYPEAMATEHLLRALTAAYPADANWSFYQAEMFQRRGNWKEAEKIYQNTIKIDNDNRAAYLRLGMVAEAACQQITSCEEALAEAAHWYLKYCTLNADDIVGLQKLSDANKKLHRAETEGVQTQVDITTDDLGFVAGVLGVPVERVVLGANLVQNSDFSVWDKNMPAHWHINVYAGQSNKEAVYMSAADALIPSGHGVRILSLRGASMKDGTRTYAEYAGDDFKIRRGKYLVTVTYNSSKFADGSGLLFIGGNRSASDFVLVNQLLPETRGRWLRVRLFVDVPEGENVVMPLLRNWGEGNLYVDSLDVRAVSTSVNMSKP